MKRCIISICLILLGGLSIGQPFNFRHLTMADGLPGHRELQLCEDPYGRIWIGGVGGIGIFDGAQLESIFRDDQWGLKGFQVNQIIRSNSGAMWVATNESVQFLRPGAGKFSQALLQTGEHLKDILLLGETTKGEIIAFSENQVFRCKERVCTFSIDTALTALVQQNGKTMLLKHVKGNDWLISSRNATMIIDIETAKPIKSYNTLYIWCAEKVNEDHLLTGSFGRDTVTLLNLTTGSRELVNDWPVSDGSRFGGYIGGIVHVGNSIYAMASRYYGVYMVDVINRSIKRIMHSTADPYSIINNFCRTAFISSSGMLFISSSGLSYTQVEPPFFAKQERLALDNAETYDAFIHTFLQTDKTTMWIGGNNGLMRWNPQKQTGTLFKVFAKGNKQSPPRTARSVLTDSLGRIWVGTYGAGIALLKGNTFQTYDRDDTLHLHHWPGNDTYALVADEHGSFWVATDAGPAHFNPYSQKGVGFRNHDKLKHLNGTSCFYILPAPGRTFFAMNTGLFAFDSLENRLDTIYATGSKSRPVHGLARDGKGNLYAACFDGLRIFDEVTGRPLRRLSRKDGLLNEQLMGVKIDSAGQVWLIGLQGIAMYRPEDSKLQMFTVRDGVLRSDFRYNALYLSPNGIMYAGNDGFNYFDPYKVQIDTTALQVYTFRIQAADSIFNLEGKALICHPGQRTLQFHYLASDLRVGPYIEYRYMLQGLDTTFIYAGKQRMARYTNLKPGKYTFIAEASADGIHWYQSPPVNLELKKALWEKIWFRTTFVALLLLGTYLFLRRYISGIQRSAELRRKFENQIAEVRMNLLRSQMNPHFIFNSLNSINHFILSNDRQNASGYLTKFSRLMRLMLDNSRSEWVLLSNELKALELYIQLEAMRLNKSFAYKLYIAENIDTETLMLPPMLLQPFIENAIWHGLMHRKDNAGELNIEVSENNERLSIKLKDNGIGRKASALLQKKNQPNRKSHGIKITEERLNMVNEIYKVNATLKINDLWDEKGVCLGTEVMIEMDKAQS
jgi:ligand-binding sensor domain-containing protein